LTKDYKIKNKNVEEFGKGLLIESSEYDNHYFVRGNYEIKHILVHQISKLTELNGTEYMLLQVPNQKEISDIMLNINNQIRDENWFSSPLDGGQKQFTKFESHLRKALAEFNPDDNSKIGLLGELYILDSFLKLKSSENEEEKIINAWSGYQSTSRDFIFGDCCVEVKTTTKSESTHEINNLNQVDPRDDDGGITELFLASIGVGKKEDGESIVSLTNSIVEKIKENDLQKKFLDDVRHYGVNSIGYNHERMANWSQFQENYQVLFSRFYNMGDPNIKVIRFSDLSEMMAVNERTVKYQINLDPIIEDSSNNPLNLEEFTDYLFEKF